MTFAVGMLVHYDGPVPLWVLAALALAVRLWLVCRYDV